MPLAPGSRLGSYEIQSPLGTGGSGEVYRARDTRLDRLVAIKILSARDASSAELRARFEQEARSISALQHPNICVLHDVGSQDGTDFMVMEFVSGKTLDKLIPPGGMPPEMVLKYAIQAADALARAHAARIIHRDLKPSNVMVDDSGLVKVLDFGLAKLTAAQLKADAATMVTTEGVILGTVAYMSPEQAEGRRLDARSDVFSFGSVLYEMLTGRKAFEGPSTAAVLSAVMRDDPKPLNEVRHDVRPELRRIVTRCLKKDPTARFASGAELLQELKSCRELLFPESGAGMTLRRIAHAVKRPSVLIPGLLVLAALAAGIVFQVKRSREARWARETALPEITRLADQGRFADFGEAFALADRAEKSLPDDSALAKLWPLISYQVSLDTNPSGAMVYRRDYSDARALWELVGQTPLRDVRQPRGTFLWKFDRPGYATAIQMTGPLFGFFSSLTPLEEPVAATVTLDEQDRSPAGMVRVSQGTLAKELRIPGYEGKPSFPLTDYWIDQYEVTNRQFKEFVDQGGYQKKEYWVQPFIQDGNVLPWERAMALFHDSTGQPGPKDWVQGEYAKGHDDFPVSGVSWFEAAAYAEFAAKSLPTIYHWNRASGSPSAAYIVPASNFGSRGVAPVGSHQGIGPFGTYDMAGNVKEWVLNEAEPGKRYVLGGSWDEPNYMFVDPDGQSPFQRAANTGFRCMKLIGPEPNLQRASLPMPSPRRDLSQVKPAPDALFRAYRGTYSYDKVPLNAMVEHVQSTDEEWTAEKITYTAAYGNERAISYLFLPKQGKPPYQTVLFFPGSADLSLRQFRMYPTASLDAILKSGRAVLYPVYKSTFERGDNVESDNANMSSTWRDHVVMWAKDASRALDYAETRPELDHQKVAYYGYSWGAVMGAIIPAVEPRIKVCVFAVGGLEFPEVLPEVDPVNFAPRVTQPVLMLNGHYDFFYPQLASQEPLYQLLGSKKDEKKHMLYDSGHSIPRNELIKETRNWLDQYLGPVY